MSGKHKLVQGGPNGAARPAPPIYGKMGPAMIALPTDNQRAFVQHWVQSGGRSAAECARIAGYSDPGTNAINVIAHRLAHDEKIQAAILEESRKMLQGLAPMAVGVITNVLGNPSHKDNLKAAGMVLDRVGMHAKLETLNTTRNIEDRTTQIREAVELCRELGMDPRKLLGKFGVQLDAEFKELPAPEPDNVIDAEFTDENLFEGAAP